MTDQPSEPRELTPVQMFWGQKKIYKDYTVAPVPSDTEVEEVEEAITPAPKDLPVPESVISSESPPSTVPPELETLVPPPGITPTEALEAAAKESGKVNDESEDVPPTQPTTTPEPDDSSPSSSSEQSPGKPLPPAPVKPPTVG